jgi:hypothetical protein
MQIEDLLTRLCLPAQLTELPSSVMYVGRTCLTLRDIRNYNHLQEALYILHKNDCRCEGQGSTSLEPIRRYHALRSLPSLGNERAGP